MSNCLVLDPLFFAKPVRPRHNADKAVSYAASPPPRGEAQALRQGGKIGTRPTRALQGGAGEVAGDGAFAHGAVPSLNGRC